MLAFGIEDRLAHLGRKQAVLLDFRRRYQTGHTELVEASHVAIEGALGGTGLGGAFSG
jgi:hypothetical protein